MTATTSFDSFFDEITTDNNGITCCDINAGIDKLYRYFNENDHDLVEEQRYLVAEHEAGYPDIVAQNSILGGGEYWWWILFLNRLEDPFTGMKTNWVYSVNSTDQVSDIISGINSENTSSSNSTIGTVVDLN